MVPVLRTLHAAVKAGSSIHPMPSFFNAAMPLFHRTASPDRPVRSSSTSRKRLADVHPPALSNARTSLDADAGGG